MVFILNQDSVASAGVFLARQLEQRLPKVYEKKYPSLRFGNGTLLPATADLEAGADSIVEEVLETSGEVDLALADGNDDLNFADVSITEARFPVQAFAVGIRYSVRELEAAQKGNRPLRAMKEMAARRAIEEKVNRIGAFGDSRYGMRGLINDPTVPTVDLSTNFYATGTSADDLIRLITDQVTKIVTDTNLTEEPNTLLVPVALHERMTNQRIPDSPLTVKQFILQNNTWIEDIQPVNELSNANLRAGGVLANNVTNKDALFIYPKSPDIVHRSYQPLIFLQPQLRGMNYIVPAYMATTGAINHYPGSCLRVTFNNA